jgi:transcriptional regulator with XRE-family HTH domain
MTEPGSPFGVLLRRWRRHRGLSQLALAGRVGSTGRHVSFLETGRSRPSRVMVLRLGDALDVPVRDRNELLVAAGFAPAYPHTAVTAAELAPYRAALDRLLTAHEPYPALVVDAHWTVLSANRACARLFGADLVGANLVRRMVADPAAAAGIVNWPEVARAGLARLRRQADRTPTDEELRRLVTMAESAVAGSAVAGSVVAGSVAAGSVAAGSVAAGSTLAGLPPADAGPAGELVVCPWFRVGDEVVRTIAMAARFETAVEVTLDELRVELFYPLDAAAERFFRSAPD